MHCTCMKLSLVSVVCDATTHQVRCNVLYVVQLVLDTSNHIKHKSKTFSGVRQINYLSHLAPTGFRSLESNQIQSFGKLSICAWKFLHTHD